LHDNECENIDSELDLCPFTEKKVSVFCLLSTKIEMCQQLY
jgi:hypothetical protein